MPKSDMNTSVFHEDGHGGPRPTSENDVPFRFELFILGDGEKKVTEEPDTRKSPGFYQDSRHLST